MYFFSNLWLLTSGLFFLDGFFYFPLWFALFLFIVMETSRLTYIFIFVGILVKKKFGHFSLSFGFGLRFDLNLISVLNNRGDWLLLGEEERIKGFDISDEGFFDSFDSFLLIGIWVLTVETIAGLADFSVRKTLAVHLETFSFLAIALEIAGL